MVLLPHQAWQAGRGGDSSSKRSAWPRGHDQCHGALGHASTSPALRIALSTYLGLQQSAGQRIQSYFWRSPSFFQISIFLHLKKKQQRGIFIGLQELLVKGFHKICMNALYVHRKKRRDISQKIIFLCHLSWGNIDQLILNSCFAGTETVQKPPK